MCACCWRNHHPEEEKCLFGIYCVVIIQTVLSTIKLSIFIFHLFIMFFFLVLWPKGVLLFHNTNGYIKNGIYEDCQWLLKLLFPLNLFYYAKWWVMCCINIIFREEDVYYNILFYSCMIIRRKFIHFALLLYIIWKRSFSPFHARTKINKNHLQDERIFLYYMWIWQSMHWDLPYNLFADFF